MPAIVLALAQDIKPNEDVTKVIQDNKDSIIILDGLQRSGERGDGYLFHE